MVIQVFKIRQRKPDRRGGEDSTCPCLLEDKMLLDQGQAAKKGLLQTVGKETEDISLIAPTD